MAALKRRKSPLRWLVLFLTVVVVWGPYWAFDTPAATEPALREHMGVPSKEEERTSADRSKVASFNTHFDALYSVGAFPNIVLPLVAGVLLDFLGARPTLMGLATLATVGQVLFAVGCETKSWAVMLLGRTLFGVGEGSLLSALNAINVRWWSPRELGFALAFLVCSGRLASAANDNISALFVNPTFAYGVGAGLCFISFVAASVFAGLDLAFDRVQQGLQPAFPFSLLLPAPNSRQFLRDEDEMAVDAMSLNEGKEDDNTDSDEPAPSVWSSALTAMSSVRHLPWRAYYLALLSIPGFTPSTTFNNIGEDYISFRWGDTHSRTMVGFTLSLMYIGTAVFVPIAGKLVDRTNRRVLFLLGSLIVTIVVHILLLTWTDVPLQLPFSLLGISFAFFAGPFWTAVAHSAPKDLQGVAFGFVTSAQNFGMAFTPILVSFLEPPACNDTFLCTELFFIGSAALAILLCIVLIVLHEPGVGRGHIPDQEDDEEQEHQKLIDQAYLSDLGLESDGNLSLPFRHDSF